MVQWTLQRKQSVGASGKCILQGGDDDLCPLLQAGRGRVVNLLMYVCLLQLAENSRADTFSSAVTCSFEISEMWACHFMAVFPQAGSLSLFELQSHL